MLKKRFLRKMLITLAVLFSLFLMQLLPRDRTYTQTLEYVSSSVKEAIYLIDSYGRVARTSVLLNEEDITLKARKMLDYLTLDGPLCDKLPSGFKGIIPLDTKTLDINYDKNTLKLNFSKDFLDVDVSNEEKMIEAIVFSLTEIDGVDKVSIYVEDNILLRLPKSKINIPAILDRSFGINKEYSFSDYHNVDTTTIYYISKYNEDYYYVPVTKYTNDSREKIKIIIDELSTSPTRYTNLMSFLNGNVELLATQEEVNDLFLVFNEYIFSDMATKNILEEVIYSISLSVKDNYNVEEVIFKVNDNEIYKSVLKTLE